MPASQFEQIVAGTAPIALLFVLRAVTLLLVGAWVAVIASSRV